MSLTPADIKSRFPEFGELDVSVVQRWLDEAETNHNACQWGGKADDGLAWLTAHFLASFAVPESCGYADHLGPGPLTGSTEDRVSASWSPLTVPKIFAANDLGTTKYGRRYLSLVDTLFACRCT